MKTLLATVLCLCGMFQADALSAQQPASPLGPNGGSLQSVGTYRIETVIMPKGIMFRVADDKGQAISAPAAQGTLTLKVADKPKTFTYKLQAMKNGALGAAINLSKVEGLPLHLEVELVDVGPAPIRFETTEKLTPTLSDTLLISLQKTCPVTGKALGSMGAPPKVFVDGKPLFVCCKPCSGKLTATPDAYLAKYYEAKGKEIRPGVFQATLADASAIAAQKKCPVMDEELGGMGAPQKVNVNGKAVYICCAGCAKKLHAEPAKYLDMLAKQGVTPPDFD